MKSIMFKLFQMLYTIYCHLIPTSKYTIIFESNLGNNFAGNPKALLERMIAQGLTDQYQCYVVLKQPGSAQVPPEATVLKRRSPAYFKVFAKAGIWISDSRMPLYLVKKKDVLYLQTWHGTPLKKLALDMDSLDMGGSTNLQHYQDSFRRNVAYWDILLSQNAYSSEIFRRCFDFHGRMLESGYPRCDLLTKRNTESDILKIKYDLGIPIDKKVILYAPTWRDDEFYERGNYKYSPQLDIDLLKEQLGDEYVLLIKFHYLVSCDIDWSKYDGFVYDFSKAEDISPLYLCADAMITDYSSVMFDYAILDRPMYFFCYDLEKYRDTLRGFYFDFEETAPGPIVQTTSALIEAINSDSSNWNDKRTAFRQKFVSLEDGYSSDRVLKEILSGR